MGATTPGAELEGTPGLIMADEFDRRFIDMLVPHHQSAVEMANLAKQRAEHAELKQLAEEIVTEQTAEIKQLQAWRQQWYGSSHTPPMTAMPLLSGMPGIPSDHVTMNATVDVEKLRSTSESFDQIFIDLMTAHHQMAIDAARVALAEAQHAEVKELAQTIIDSQQHEIDLMTAWEQSWYGDNTPAGAAATP